MPFTMTVLIYGPAGARVVGGHKQVASFVATGKVAAVRQVVPHDWYMWICDGIGTPCPEHVPR
jgi:hypothetical protein